MSKTDGQDGGKRHGEESRTERERGGDGVGGADILDQIRVGGLPAKVTSEQRCEVGEPSRVSGESFLGRGNRQCMGTEVRARLEDLREY